MKRGQPLKRKTPMRRTAMKPTTRKSKYKRRPRDVTFMLWVKRQPCAARGLGDPCDGPVQADHAGRRGIGQKAPDETCIPLCRRHHQCRDAFSGPFKTWKQVEMREWLERQVTRTTHEYGVTRFGRRA